MGSVQRMRMILIVTLVIAATSVAATFPIMAQEEDTTTAQEDTTAQEGTVVDEGTLVFVPAQTAYDAAGSAVMNEPPGVTLRCTADTPFVFNEIEGGTCVYEQTGSPTDVTCDVPTTLTANVLGRTVTFEAFECGGQQPQPETTTSEPTTATPEETTTTPEETTTA